MKIVDRLITIFVQKILQDMEKLSDELYQNKDFSPIEKANQDLKNQEVYKKLYARQSLLMILRIF